MIDDTDAEALDVMTAHRLALAGLRSRHPDESDGQLLRRLARIRLGDFLEQAIEEAEKGD